MTTSPLFLLRENTQSPSVWGWLWHFLGLGLVVVLASFAAWHTIIFWRVSEGPLQVALVGFAYLAAAGVVERLTRFPRAKGVGIVFLSVSIAFLLLVALVALGRLYYSRSFLLIAYVGSLMWLALRFYLFSRLRTLRLGVVPGGMALELLRLTGVEWVPLELPRVPNALDGVVVDLHQQLSPEWIRFLADCSLRGVPVYHAAVAYEDLTGRVSLRHLSEGVVETFRLPPAYPLIKRVMDTLLVFLGLPVTLPVMLVVAFLIKLDSPGPVLFIQERMGQGERPFRMVKFRTMFTDAERDGAKFARDGDHRVTRVGRWLRKFRLDELPQFWNVLKGEMSLVGPRPEQVPFAQQFAEEIPYYSYRHLVKPGITGWAQVTQGYAAGKEETQQKLEYDLYYVKHFSFWLDFLIFLKTIRTIATGFGAK